MEGNGSWKAPLKRTVDQNLRKYNKKTKTMVPIKNKIFTRCAPNKVWKLLQTFKGGPKEEIVKELGFGSLLNLECRKINVRLCAWLAEQFEYDECCLVVHGKKVLIHAGHVEKILGLNSSGLKVSTSGNVDDIKYLSNKFCNKDGRIPLVDLEESLESNDVLDDDFRVRFVLFLIGHLLCPTSAFYVTQNFLYAVKDVARIRELNWAQLVLDKLVCGIRLYRLDDSTYIQGCMLFLQLIYYDSLTLASRIKPRLERPLPRIILWTSQNINKLKGDIAKKGNFMSTKVTIVVESLPPNSSLPAEVNTMQSVVRNELHSRMEMMREEFQETMRQRLEMESKIEELKRVVMEGLQRQMEMIRGEMQEMMKREVEKMRLKIEETVRREVEKMRREMEETMGQEMEKMTRQEVETVGVGGLNEKKVELHANPHPKKKLIILDVNGLLADLVFLGPNVCLFRKPNKLLELEDDLAVFTRPHCLDFLKFCFDTFSVAVWSSQMRDVDKVADFLFGCHRNDLLFCWDQSNCRYAGCVTFDNVTKPLYLKELKKVWEIFDGYDESNTLLLDDSPSKALANPENTAIFPKSYYYKNTGDTSLGPNGDLRNYIEQLCLAENVQQYVQKNPFGQEAISEKHPHWDIYSKIKCGQQLNIN